MSIQRVVFDWKGEPLTVTYMYDRHRCRVDDPKLAEMFAIEGEDGEVRVCDIEFAQIYTMH